MDDFYLMDEMIGMFINPGERFREYIYTNNDKKILKELAKQKLEIASLSVHKERISMWKSLNDLKDVRPMVWINEIPWHEMNVDDQLTCRTSTEFTRTLETRIRRSIYRWKYLSVDMIVEPTMPCYLEIENTGFGISEIVDISRTDKSSNIISRDFKPQIENEEDLEKIKTPKIDFRKKDTEKKFEAMRDIFEDILEVKKAGYPGFWFSSWDELIRWWDVQKLLLDLILKPELIHKAMKKLTNAYLNQLDQFESQNLLSSNNGNFRIGSGALGYTNELPERNSIDTKVKTKDIWGSSAAQIFSSISPDMHVEFALQYEIQWMKRFGLNYYGCCEPLDKKIDILKKIPNLRKISMSPWVDLELGAKNIGRDYVFSYKPNPAIFAEETWNPEEIKKKLIEDLKKIKNCNVEIIMKDISTVKYKPQRLWEWAKIATEVTEKFS